MRVIALLVMFGLAACGVEIEDVDLPDTSSELDAEPKPVFLTDAGSGGEAEPEPIPEEGNKDVDDVEAKPLAREVKSQPDAAISREIADPLDAGYIGDDDDDDDDNNDDYFDAGIPDGEPPPCEPECREPKPYCKGGECVSCEVIGCVLGECNTETGRCKYN